MRVSLDGWRFILPDPALVSGLLDACLDLDVRRMDGWSARRVNRTLTQGMNRALARLDDWAVWMAGDVRRSTALVRWLGVMQALRVLSMPDVPARGRLRVGTHA